ncbi:MAG TPA: metallophosphoesterase [Gammaproteobacteria bacterium]
MTLPGKKIVLAAAALAFLCSGAASAQPEWRWSRSSKIVVVPDIHGAYSELVALLEATDLVDANLDWIGGDATLVTLGDLVDRGAGSRKVLDLLMRLQRRAAEQGGAVHVLLGNHELMNLTGDLRYVSQADYAAFTDEESPALRASAYERFLADRRAAGGSEADARAAFERLYPPGFFARERAFRADGRYGTWLLTLPALIVVNDTAFVHGGLPEIVASTGAAALNQQIGDDLRRYLRLRARLVEAGVLPAFDPRQDLELARAARGNLPPAPEAPAPDVPAFDAAPPDAELANLLDAFLALAEAPELGVDGPLWYRGSVYCNPFLEEPVLAAALDRLEAARVVVGHTPTEDRRPRELYDGRLIMLDTGMLTAYYAGRPAALVIDGERTLVQELGAEEPVPLERGRLEADGLTEAQVLETLSQGAVKALEDGARFRATTRVQVLHNGKSIEALFYPRGRAADRELAAYRLDRLLSVNLVPPTVEREVEGERGALQLVYRDAITESERIEQRTPLGGWCPIEPQAELMRVFDLLTANTGRTGDNILYRRESSVLKLVDHAEAFGAAGRLRLRRGSVELTPALRAALASLDRNTLESAIGQWIDADEIEALLERRDALLEQAASSTR